jgi:hypothetical protein
MLVLESFVLVEHRVAIDRGTVHGDGASLAMSCTGCLAGYIRRNAQQHVVRYILEIYIRASRCGCMGLKDECSQ